MKSGYGLKFLAAQDDYQKQFSSILKLYAPTDDPDLSHLDASLISNCGDTKLDLLLNESKYKAMQCLFVIWSYLLKRKPKDLYSTSNSYIVFAQLFSNLISKSLIALGQSKRFE